MLNLQIEESGAGEPVVLLHSHGLSGGQWRRLANTLVAGRFRVLAVDLTGHGLSPPWPEPTPFSFTIDVDRVSEIVRAVQPAHVVGHSYGGLVALHVALTLPDSVRTLSLFDPVAFGVLDANEDRDTRTVLAALERSWDAEPQQRERWLRTFVEFWSGPGAWDALREDARDEFRRVAWVVREGVRTLAEDTMPVAQVVSLRVPTLLLTGEHSPLPAQRVVERLAQILPHSRRVVVPGVGHLGPVTHARNINSHLVEATMGTYFATRIERFVDISYTAFTNAFEALLARIDATAFAELTSWEPDAARAKLASLMGVADFVLVQKLDHGGALTALAARPTRAMTYVFGNPLVGVEMTKLDARAGLYGPPRLFVQEIAADRVLVTYDLYSASVAQFKSAKLDEIARSVDRKVERLIDATIERAQA